MSSQTASAAPLPRVLTTVATGVLAAFAGAASAQGQAPQELEEVLVTAQNRSESIQDVPIAIDLVSGEELAKANITDVRELERLVPAVQISQDTSLTYVFIRGIGTSSNNETQDTSVAVNIDGEYINRPNVLNASLFDMERVEALRGPQGTLQGRNATAGALNFITRKPKFENGFGGSLSYGNFDQVIANAGADFALNDRFAVRVAGIYANRGEGYNEHANLAPLQSSGFYTGRPFQPDFTSRSGDQDMWGARVSLRAEPTDALAIDLAVETIDSSAITDNQAFVNLLLPANTAPAGCAGNGYIEIAPLIAGAQCYPQNTNFLAGINRNKFDAPNSGVGLQEIESTAIRGRLSYDFGAATLSYIGGYRQSDSVDAPTLSPTYVFLSFNAETEAQSHELRLNGGEVGGFQWQGGAFYFSETLDVERGLYSPLIGPLGGYITYFRRPGVDNEAWSAFAQFDIPVSDTLTAQAGVRYTDTSRNAVFENLGFRANTGPVRLTIPATGTGLLNLRAGETNTSWLVGLNYKPNDDMLVYGKVSTGFKAGGFDAVGNYGPEENTAYEVGLKQTFGGERRHLFNASAFYYDYKGLQNSVVLNNALGGQIFNAGKATIWGAEADFKFQVTDNGRFTGSVNYLNAEFDELLAAYAVLCVGCAQTSVGDLNPATAAVEQPNLAGNTPPQSPEFVVSLGYDHEFQLGSAGSLTASIFSRYKSDYFVTIYNERDLQQDAFVQTDVSFEYRPTSKKYSVQAFVQNIEDERPLVFGGFVAAGPDRIMNFGFSRPRTYGLRVGFEF